MPTQTITLSPAEIESIFEDEIRKRYKTAKSFKFSGKLSKLIPEKITIEISTSPKDDGEVIEAPKKRFSEPEFMIDDTVILIGITEEGRSLVGQFGNVWKLSTAATNPARYIMYSRHSEVQGKFSGKITGKGSSNGVANLHKDCNDPNRIFRVIGVCKFPKEFKWKEYWVMYEKMKIDIKKL